MKKEITLIIYLLFSFVGLAFCRLATVEEVQDTITAVEVVPGQELRAYSVTYWPNTNPRYLNIVGLGETKNGDEGDVDAVQFVMNTILQTTLEFAYFHASAQVTTTAANTTQVSDATIAGFAFILRMFDIGEFVNNDGVPGYQAGTGPNADEITGGYDLSSLFLSWKGITVNTSQVTGPDGNPFNVFIATAETTDEVFMIRFIVAGKPIEAEGIKITPDSVKVDFSIKWFNNPLNVKSLWSTGPSNPITYPDAQVLITSAMAAKAGAATESQGDSPSLTFATGPYAGFFSWSPNAEVTVSGVAAGADVVATVTDPDVNTTASFLAGWVIKVMVFTFNGSRPSEVAWDPSFGANLDYSSLNGAFSQQPALLMAILMVVVVFVFGNPRTD